MAGSLLCMAPSLKAAEKADEVKLKTILSKTENFHQPGEPTVDGYLAWLRSDAGKSESKFLTEHYSDLSRSKQRSLAEELACTGAEAAAPFLCRSLADPQVGDEVIRRIGYAFLPGRNLEPAFCEQLAPAVLPWVAPEKGYPATPEALQVLAKLSPELAMKHFYKEEYFSPAAARIEEALKAFNAAGIRLPQQKIDELLNAWEARAERKEETDRRPFYLYVEALSALAVTDPERAVRLTDELQRERPHDAYCLAPVIEKAYGLENLVWWLSSALDDPPSFAAIPPEARRYISATSILMLADEGIEQAFTTTACNEWDDALQAMDEAGDVEYPKFLRAVAQLFGPDGPPADYAQRQKAIEAMNPPFHEQVDAVYEKWAEGQKGKTYLDTRYLLAKYAGKHAEVLRKWMRPLK